MEVGKAVDRKGVVHVYWRVMADPRILCNHRVVNRHTNWSDCTQVKTKGNPITCQFCITAVNQKIEHHIKVADDFGNLVTPEVVPVKPITRSQLLRPHR